MERRQLERSQPAVKGLTLFFVLALSASAAAQAADPKVTGTLSNVTRVESWSYFQPAEPDGNPDYTFFGDRAELGVHVKGVRFDLGGAFNYVRIENLPTHAIGPGGLGTGAFYFAATGLPYSYQLYVGELTLGIKSRDQRTSLTIGRMARLRQGYGEAGFVNRLINERIASRLIGDFEWSYYQRRFDGARFELDRDTWHLNASAFMPTQGGFEESTNLTMPKIQVGEFRLARKRPSGAFEGFAYLYRDRRDPKAVVDNSQSTDRPVDITVATFGGSYAGVFGTSQKTDIVAWGAVQTGDWYGRDHRAGSAALEAGHRWSNVSFKPWVRGGYLWASGDADGGDARHGTFFSMLPSSRKYALSSVYSQMNLRDAFAQLLIEPRRFSARIEVHAVHLANAADLWYQGSGATASEGRYFGFSGRASGGHTALGSIVEGTVDVPIKKYWSVNGYAAMMSAGDAVRTFFTDQRLTFWSIENVFRF